VTDIRSISSLFVSYPRFLQRMTPGTDTRTEVK